MSRIRRPRAFIATIAVLAATALAIVGCSYFNAPAVNTFNKVRFTNALNIPPVASSTTEGDGTRVFNLTAQTGTTQFLSGRSTKTWGYNGAYLGPTLRAESGEKVRVNINNHLPESTTLHWHGMHLPAIDDGGPHQPIAPGAELSPSWTIKQAAATLWYHPHPDGRTEKQVRNGLAGMFILDDPAEEALPIPHQYGVDDIPLMVQDAAFDDDNQLTKRDGGYSGNLGDQVLVNGTLDPFVEVSSDVVRLRLVNASSARVYNFAFSDGSTFFQIASDGGLLDAPVPSTSLQLSPGERAEILVQLTPGHNLTLRSDKPRLGDTSAWNGTNGGQDQFDILQLRPSPDLAHRGEIPTALVPVPRLNAADAVQTRYFDMDKHKINDAEMDLERIDAAVTLGSTEIWQVENTMGSPHNFHVHDLQFQILDIDGSAPPAGMAGWKDTVYLPPDTRFRLIMQFTDYADPEHPYMFHCHFLQHEDDGMMAQFVVLNPGETVPDHWDTSDADLTDGGGHSHEDDDDRGHDDHPRTGHHSDDGGEMGGMEMGSDD
jgi:bilirubin oxidase